MLELLANAAMSAKADEACNAPTGERDEGALSAQRLPGARALDAAGDVTLKIPKLRRGSFFPEHLIERYCRALALVAAVAEMYVAGDIDAQGGSRRGRARRGRCRSRRCRACASAWTPRWTFRGQRFDGVRFAYLWLDAHLREVPRGGRSASQAVVTAIWLDDTKPQALRRRGLRGHGEPRRVEGVPPA